MISKSIVALSCGLITLAMMLATNQNRSTMPLASSGLAVHDTQPSFEESSNEDAEEGRRLLLEYRFLPRDFHQSTFDELWQDWPEELRAQAASASAAERRQMAFDRYGMTGRPQEPEKPMQFVVDDEGFWAMNCFACHGGKVAGRAIEGLPNAHIALETLYADLRRTKARMGKPINQMDLGAIAIPMGTSRGVTNAVVFGIALMAYRDKDLNVRPFAVPRPSIIHHDMDAPPWWNVSKRDRLYIDGFVEKNHRALIPFVMDQRTRGQQLRDWEDEFEKVFAYIESLAPPKYPFAIDSVLADKGQVVFAENCSRCHGTYGDDPSYPAKIVDLETVGTDPIRLKALTPDDRRAYHESWFAHYGEDHSVIDPEGYQAPPLDGVWATAPYFHNGSVPSLRLVIKPDERPTVWKRQNEDYDQVNLGINFERYERIPRSQRRGDLKREFYNTRARGKSAAGHDFGAHLSEKQLTELLEYLKTL